MNAKVYKVELMIIDHEGTEENDVRMYLEGVKYLYPTVTSFESREIAEWDDDHPLNKKSTWHQEFERLFN